MNLQTLKNTVPRRLSNGRPSTTLTDKEWQTRLEIMKLYITPYKNKTRMSGRFSRESGNEYTDKEYDGITNWQSYCSFINSILQTIRNGEHDFCYFDYQIADLLKFHYDTLRTRYKDGYFEVWLER